MIGLDAGPGGDGDFDAFFRRAYPRLVRILSTADSAAADAVQEAFIQASLRWSRVSRYDDPEAYVRRVALNRLANGRRSRRRLGAALPRLAAPATMPGPDPERLDLALAMAALPARQRLALALFYLADLPVEALAEEMRLSPGTVRAHLHQGRRALAAALALPEETQP